MYRPKLNVIKLSKLKKKPGSDSRREKNLICDASGVHPTRDKCDPARMVTESGVAATTREGAKVDEYKQWYHVEKGQLIGLGFEVFGALGKLDS